jgi:homoserine kinase
VSARGFRVRVPASSANLGPGFDTFAAAVDLALELEVVESDGFSIEVGGLEVPEDRENLCVRAFESLKPADDVSFVIRSEIPLAGGLGSSAAATVAGLLAADQLFDLSLDPQEILSKASEIEGHSDNAAAALFGGFVICDPGSGESAGVTRLGVPAGIEGVLVTPSTDRVPTSEARAALPEQVPLSEASENIAAASRLILGIERSDADLISRGLTDRLHQPRREHLFPRSMQLVAEAESCGALGATISGAGPSVLVWTSEGEGDAVLAALGPSIAGWGEARRIRFSADGARVSAL